MGVSLGERTIRGAGGRGRKRAVQTGRESTGPRMAGAERERRPRRRPQAATEGVRPMLVVVVCPECAAPTFLERRATGGHLELAKANAFRDGAARSPRTRASRTPRPSSRSPGPCRRRTAPRPRSAISSATRGAAGVARGRPRTSIARNPATADGSRDCRRSKCLSVTPSGSREEAAFRSRKGASFDRRVSTDPATHRDLKRSAGDARIARVAPIRAVVPRALRGLPCHAGVGSAPAKTGRFLDPARRCRSHHDRSSSQLGWASRGPSGAGGAEFAGVGRFGGRRRRGQPLASCPSRSPKTGQPLDDAAARGFVKSRRASSPRTARRPACPASVVAARRRTRCSLSATTRSRHQSTAQTPIGESSRSTYGHTR